MVDISSVIGKRGELVRPASAFRDWISADGSTGFKAEPGRYHIYVSLACPWAHRTLIVRKLKGLEDVITVTVVDWFLSEKGWTFTDQKPKCSLDTVNNFDCLRQIYLKANPDYNGRCTVPALWDKVKKTIVNNESSEIIRMLNNEFNAFCKVEEQRMLDIYPEILRTQIDELDSWIYPNINNGVYRCGFARSQEAYDEAVQQLFDHLDKVEDILSKSRYLTWPNFTEADVKLFTTLVRFDWVYQVLFKCNKKKLIEYPNIWGYTRDIYQSWGLAETVDREHIIKHYYYSLESINPFRVVAVGPDLDFTEPHSREQVGQ